MPKGLFQQGDLDVLTFKSGVAMALGYPPRNMYFVNSANGTAAQTVNNTGLTPGEAFGTLAQAINNCLDNKGDCVVVMAGHSETLGTTTAGLTLSKSGVDIIGMGNARSRPVFTCGAADIPGILMSGSSNRLKNVRLVASASQTSKSAALINFTGTDNIVEDNVFEHGSTGGLDALIFTAAHRTVTRRNLFLSTGTACQCAIQVKGTSNNTLIEKNYFNYGINVLKSAVVFASVGSNLSGGMILDNMVSGANLKFLNIISTIATNTTAGLCSGNRIGYAASLTLLASTTITPGDMAVMDQHEVDGKRIQPIVYGVVSIHPSSVINAHAAIMHT